MSTHAKQPPSASDASLNIAEPEPAISSGSSLHRIVNEQRAKDIWILLLVFRCANALLVRTFFQPDEYFQSLEPAWQMAFGSESGAWITWVRSRCKPLC